MPRIAIDLYIAPSIVSPNPMEEKFSNYDPSKDFVTLSAWKKASLTMLFFYKEVIPLLPAEEKYSLGVQMRRAGVSARANIAEGYGRFHFKEGTRHYRIARGSLYELKDHLISCLDLEFIDNSLYEKGVNLIEQAKVTLNGYIKFVEAQQPK